MNIILNEAKNQKYFAKFLFFHTLNKSFEISLFLLKFEIDFGMLPF